MTSEIAALINQAAALGRRLAAGTDDEARRAAVERGAREVAYQLRTMAAAAGLATKDAR